MPQTCLLDLAVARFSQRQPGESESIVRKDHNGDSWLLRCYPKGLPEQKLPCVTLVISMLPHPEDACAAQRIAGRNINAVGAIDALSCLGTDVLSIVVGYLQPTFVYGGAGQAERWCTAGVYNPHLPLLRVGYRYYGDPQLAGVCFKHPLHSPVTSNPIPPPFLFLLLMLMLYFLKHFHLLLLFH